MAKDPGRTEQATPKRRGKARNKGNVPRSQEVAKTTTILVGTIMLYLWIGHMGTELQILMRHFFAHSFEFEVTSNNVNTLFLSTAYFAAKLTLPVMLLIGICVILIIRVQVGSLWTTQPMKPELNRFNPISGIKRMVLSPQMIIRLGVACSVRPGSFAIAP